MSIRAVSEAIKVARSAKADQNDGSIEGYGLLGALEEMVPHWESHLKDGQSPEIMATDLMALEEKIREVRSVIEDGLNIKREGAVVTLDNGKTFIPVKENLRVIHSDVDVPGEDEAGELEFNFTKEGLITDLWVNRDEESDHNLGTESETFFEMSSRLSEKNQ